jgi:NTP pyrophosphatase (non-canonical NTP hydrolase)
MTTDPALEAPWGEAAFWEQIAEEETARRRQVEQRFNQVTGRLGNEIGRLRKALAVARAFIPGPSQSEVADWLRSHFGDTSVTDQALVLAEEVGELCRAVVKRAQGVRGTREQWTAELHTELADVQLVLLALAAAEGVDLHTATRERWAVITSRNPTAERAPAA